MSTDIKVGHVGKKDVALDNFGDGRTSLLQDRVEVLAALRGFIGDGALHHGAIGFEWDLTGAVDGGRRLDGLGLEHGEILFQQGQP